MEAIRTGANGYLLKNIKGYELIKNIFSVYKMNTFWIRLWQMRFLSNYTQGSLGRIIN